MPTPYYQQDFIDFRVDKLALLGLAAVAIAIALFVRRFRSGRRGND